MKQNDLMALTAFIATITPIMQTHPFGGTIAAAVALGFAFINRAGK